MIETAAAFISLEEGILFIRSKGVPSSTDSTRRRQEDPGPVRCTPVARWQPGRMVHLLGWCAAVFSAAAVVFDPERDPRLMLRIPSMDQLLIPFRAFVDEAEAVAFLRKAMSSPDSGA